MLEVEQRVICINIPTDLNLLGEAFGQALNFAFEEYISFTQKFLTIKTEESKWMKVRNSLKRASKMYNTKYVKPLVIIYDNINHENSEILDFLQDDAEGNADSREYNTVFIISKGAWSRVEICDLSKEDSMEYLIN
ncbi:hypothetical protein Glove_326g135 [Diversispora epigaea]|uniref:Uncharacterized protein n=1 Tax=Diversispora epigaea TaxID=1348612 RepID=A0A397HLT8_9GLOM|nr:hypothetical protein Glove_326g135 [Diversispora epigaea]